MDNKADGCYVWIEITGKCNLKCPYCYAASSIESKKVELSQQKILEMYEQFKKIKVNGVMLSGGEPTMRDDLGKLIEIGTKKYKFKMYLVSNGTYLPKELLDVLVRCKTTVQLSLDTVDPKVFTKSRGVPLLPKVMENIKTLKDNGVEVTLSSTLTKINSEYIIGLVDYAKRMDIQNIHVGEFVPYGRGKLNKNIFLTSEEHYKILKKLYDHQKKNYLFVSVDLIENFIYPIVFKQKRNSYCNSIHGFTLQIDNRGNVNYCINIPLKNPLNVNKMAVDEIYRKMKGQYRTFAVRTDDIESCKKCLVKDICAGGCRAIPYNYYNKGIKTKHPYCDSYKKLLEIVKNDGANGELDDYFKFLREVIKDKQISLRKIF